MVQLSVAWVWRSGCVYGLLPLGLGATWAGERIAGALDVDLAYKSMVMGFISSISFKKKIHLQQPMKKGLENDYRPD